ncbi:MAG: tetratricopeptide repeat protein [Lacunisphaera sp.]
MFRYLVLLAATILPAFGADDALHAQVTMLFKQRQWAEAQVILQKVTAAEPDNAAAWFYLGQSYQFRDDAEHSVPAFEKATSLAPTNSIYQCYLGDAYGLAALKAGLFAKLDWAQKCKSAYDKAVELDPKNIRARVSVMEFCRQAPGFLGGGMDKAYAQAAEIQKLDPVRGRKAYAGLYLADKKYPEAFALYESALREKPGDDDSLYSIGRLATITGQQLDRGLAALREILTQPGKANHAPTQTLVGNLLEKKGDKPAALAAYQAALTGDPKYVPALEALRKLNESGGGVARK